MPSTSNAHQSRIPSAYRTGAFVISVREGYIEFVPHGESQGSETGGTTSALEKKKTEESSRYHVAIEVKITRTKKRDRESIWNAKPSGDSAQGLWESGTTAQTSLSVPPNNRCSTVKVLTVP